MRPRTRARARVRVCPRNNVHRADGPDNYLTFYVYFCRASPRTGFLWRVGNSVAADKTYKVSTSTIGGTYHYNVVYAADSGANSRYIDFVHIYIYIRRWRDSRTMTIILSSSIKREYSALSADLGKRRYGETVVFQCPLSIDGRLPYENVFPCKSLLGK